MIGWRVGWVVGPANIVADVARVSISNVVCQTGIAMGAVATAINASDDGIGASVATWQARRDVLVSELLAAGIDVIAPHGGWSLLLASRIDTAARLLGPQDRQSSADWSQCLER